MAQVGHQIAQGCTDQWFNRSSISLDIHIPAYSSQSFSNPLNSSYSDHTDGSRKPVGLLFPSGCFYCLCHIKLLLSIINYLQISFGQSKNRLNISFNNNYRIQFTSMHFSESKIWFSSKFSWHKIRVQTLHQLAGHVWGTNPYLKSEKPDGNVAASVSFMTIGVTLSSPQSSYISQTSPFSLVFMS